VKFAAWGDPAGDYRLAKASPAVDAGTAIDPKWPDVLRPADAGKPDLGASMSGVDVEQRLPVLSTYLGHAHVTDTYWYLSAIPELLALTKDRLEKRWETLS
jgi:hypothetical protein